MLQLAFNETRSFDPPFTGAIQSLSIEASAGLLVERLQTALDADLDAARDLLRQLAGILKTPGQMDGPIKPPAGVEPLARGGLAPWQIKAVVGHIDQYLGETVHVETLATLARLSTSHFCRAFKASFGETPHTYIMRLRLELARTLMLTTSESLCQIADACGLADQAHLTRLFRRHMGDTPYNWRRTWRQAA